jgi:short subunit dehydrogenase-like uncharacterized protein
VSAVVAARGFVGGVEAAAPLVPLALPALRLALRTPLRDALEAVIGALPEGPSPAARARSAFVVVARAEAIDGRTASCAVHGRDLYGLTAVIAAGLAERLADADGLPAGGLAPAEAVEPAEFLAALAPHGVSWTDR